MKFLIAFVAIVAVASAGVVKPVTSDSAQVDAIIAAINHPSTDPATAVLLEQQLLELLGVANPTPVIVENPGNIVDSPTPIAVGPALVDFDISPEPISVGPAIIDFPLPDGGALTPVVPTPVPTPVIVDQVPEAASAPLVQIILNINAAPGAVSITPPAPVIVPETPVVGPPSPVNVVDVADNEQGVVPSPVHVVEVAEDNLEQIGGGPVIVDVPETVIVAEPIIPEPVIVVDPVMPEPVLVGTPVLPGAPAVILPEQLN